MCINKIRKKEDEPDCVFLDLRIDIKNKKILYIYAHPDIHAGIHYTCLDEQFV